jgi:acetyl/propionyl-CoA carboxylase alpha subunit
MYDITINDSRVIHMEGGKDKVFTIDGKQVTPDISQIDSTLYHILIENKSYSVEIIQHNPEEKTFILRVNNNRYKVQVRDKYDALLKELGLDALASKKAADLKAPMPGLVVEVAVTEGEEVKKGDRLVVLEAMKMENVLKADADGVVKKVNVKKGQTVEKNEVLILF